MTDGTTPESLFADVVLPLHRANKRRNVHYFVPGPEAGQPTYWEAPASRTGGVGRLGIGEGDGSALLNQLGDYWAEHDEAPLAQMLPDLEALWRDLLEPDSVASDQSGRLSLSVYPLF